MAMNPVGHAAKYHYVGEAQGQFNRQPFGNPLTIPTSVGTVT
jgi:hypothetical protein